MPLCLGCHRPGGQAPQAGAALELVDQSALDSGEMTLDVWYATNLARYSEFLEPESDGKPYFLAKALGEAEHGGGAVVEAGSSEYLALSELAQHLAAPGEADCVDDLPENPLDYVELLSPQETYRRAAVLFGARLPTPAEEANFDGLEGEAALAELDRLVDGLMQEAAFSGWLKYAWNDIFLFRGIYTEYGRILYEVANTNDFFAVRLRRRPGPRPRACTDAPNNGAGLCGLTVLRGQQAGAPLETVDRLHKVAAPMSLDGVRARCTRCDELFSAFF